MKRRKTGKQLKTSSRKAPARAAEKVVFDQAKEVRAIARERLGSQNEEQSERRADSWRPVD
jgi:hypothetical protein